MTPTQFFALYLNLQLNLRIFFILCMSFHHFTSKECGSKPFLRGRGKYLKCCKQSYAKFKQIQAILQNQQFPGFWPSVPLWKTAQKFASVLALLRDALREQWAQISTKKCQNLVLVLIKKPSVTRLSSSVVRAEEELEPPMERTFTILLERYKQ